MTFTHHTHLKYTRAANNCVVFFKVKLPLRLQELVKDVEIIERKKIKMYFDWQNDIFIFIIFYQRLRLLIYSIYLHERLVIL